MKSKINTSLGAKWIPGVMAAATATTAQAAVVQITFTNSFVKNSTTGGMSTLSLDLTGDGLQDATATIGINSTGAGIGSYYSGGAKAVAHYTASGYDRVRVGAVVQRELGRQNITVNGLAPFKFKDANINGNAITNGFAEFTATTVGADNYMVTLHRLIFDDSSPTAPVVDNGVQYPTFGAIPEPSSLGLLALGAGGLLARRRRVQAAA